MNCRVPPITAKYQVLSALSTHKYVYPLVLDAVFSLQYLSWLQTASLCTIIAVFLVHFSCFTFLSVPSADFICPSSCLLLSYLRNNFLIHFLHLVSNFLQCMSLLFKNNVLRHTLNCIHPARPYGTRNLQHCLAYNEQNLGALRIVQTYTEHFAHLLCPTQWLMSRSFRDVLHGTSRKDLLLKVHFSAGSICRLFVHSG